MRLDKFLKDSRIIKRRTVAKDACDQERVLINDKLAKAGDKVSVGDIIQISFGTGVFKCEVLKLEENVKKNQAEELYRQL